MTEQLTDRYCVLVNGHAVEPGCWVDGHWGQYAPDHLADRADELGWDVRHAGDDPRRIRRIIDWLEDRTPQEPFCRHCRHHVDYDRVGEAWIDDIGSGWTLCSASDSGAHTPTWPTGNLWEIYHTATDDLLTWLNDHTDEGYTWGWWEGEIMLWDQDTWEEWE